MPGIKDYDYQLNLPVGTEFVKKINQLIQKLEKINENDLKVKVDLTGYITSLEIVRDYQKKLVNGKNIKTINGQAILGSGDLKIESEVKKETIGSLPNLTTANKTNLVAAINEIDKLVDDLTKNKIDRTEAENLAQNLNTSISNLNTLINNLETNKATKIEVNSIKNDLSTVKSQVNTISNQYIKKVEYSESNGIFTFTLQDGTTKKIDLAIEKVVANFEYDTENNALILTLADGTKQIVPITALVGDYDGVDGDVIKVDVSGDNLISAELKGKTISETYLSDDVVSKINQGVEAKTKVDNIDGRLTVVENEYVKSVNIDEDGKLTVTLQDGSQKTIEVSSGGKGVKGFELIEKTPEIVPATASVDGLGNESPTSQVYTKDDSFPTSFEEVTDELGNIFVKIPTMYRKVDTIADNQITKFTMSTTKIDDTYEPYSVFVKPNGEVMPYVLIGKYANNSTTSMQSVSNTSPSSITIGNARTYARELGAGYQQYDWQFQKLFIDLALLVSQKANFNSGTTISSYLGIEEINYGIFIDGVVKDGTTWCISYDPTKYVDSATSSSDGYVAASYTAPTSSAEIQKLGYDSNNPFFNYPNSIVSNSSYNTYYCDQCSYSSGNRPVRSYVGYADISSGLWYCSVSTSWSSVIGARLCYRPIEPEYTDIRLTLEDDTTFDIPLSEIVIDSYSKAESDKKFVTKETFETTLDSANAALNSLNEKTIELDSSVKEIEESYVKNVSYEPNAGIFTFTMQDGSVRTVDLAIEKVVTNFEYVERSVAPTDLTGYNINVPRGWVCDSDFLISNGNSLIYHNGVTYSGIYLGYYNDIYGGNLNYESRNNSLFFLVYNDDIDSYGCVNVDNSNSFGFYCSSGPIATDTRFIQWLANNNATFTKDGVATTSEAGLQLTLADGTKQFIPLTEFIKDYTGKNGDQIQVSIVNHEIQAILKDGSVTNSKLADEVKNSFASKETETKVNTNTADISNLKTKTDTTNTDVSNLTSRVSTAETDLSGLQERVTTLEQNQGSGGGSTSTAITEEITVSSSSWVALNNADVAPYTYSANLQPTNLTDDSLSIELINNQPVLFAKHGFAIMYVSDGMVELYSIGQPSSDVTLTFEVVG